MALVIRTGTKETNIKNGERTTSIVDSSWEIIDPNPDVYALFIHFNDTFFHGALSGCEVRWSPRMTYCAGLCVYEGHGGLCSIRLSQPLLKFRPRKDLVETLLHEMIHAYLFVSAGDRDRESHGPNFQAHMKRINDVSGANITIYHNFNDEVNFYRQHWWRCVGPCRERPPYFGYVKRSMNRPPGPSDNWHEEHQRTCGGQFEKIKEPEGFSSKKKGKGADSQDTKTKKTKAADRFPGEGHVLGESTVIKMRRLDEYFGKTTGEERPTTSGTSGAIKDDSSQATCPVCQKDILSAKINEHLDECLTMAALHSD